MLEVCRAAQALPPPEQASGPLDLLLEGLARLVTEGPAAAAPALRQAVSAFASADIPMSDRLQFGPMAQGAAIALWNEEGQRAILIRQIQLARTVGALDQLPIDLVALAIDDAWRGDFADASSLIASAMRSVRRPAGAAWRPSPPCSSAGCAATRRSLSR